MDFIPERIDDSIVLNPVNFCTNPNTDCKYCPESAVAVHNWLVANELNYLVVDFQDEKEICPTIIVELLQLRKRLRFPFLFVGLMERGRNVLESYAYGEHPVFDTPEAAIEYLQEKFPLLAKKNTMSMGRFGEPIPTSRTRGQRAEVDVEEEVEEIDE